jgi:hypothetical protein
MKLLGCSDGVLSGIKVNAGLPKRLTRARLEKMHTSYG